MNLISMFLRNVAVSVRFRCFDFYRLKLLPRNYVADVASDFLTDPHSF